jgi:hypothetical protein
MNSYNRDIQQLIERAQLIAQVNRKQALLAREKDTKLLERLTRPK